jgi:hypothetical protein
MSTDPPHSLELPVSWVGIDELPVLFANQFIVQAAGRDEFIVTVGQLVGPALVGSPEQQVEQAGEIAFVPVKPVARLNLTRTRMMELIAVLNIQVERHDAAMQGIDPTGGGGQ